MVNDCMTVELRRRSPGLIISLDSDICEAVYVLSDYVQTHEVKNFASSMFSVMLTSIVLDDTSESGEAIDRLIAHYGIPPNHGQYLWGEFLTVLYCFYERYQYYDDLIDNLRSLLGSNVYDTDAELMFSVEIGRRGRCLLVR